MEGREDDRVAVALVDRRVGGQEVVVPAKYVPLPTSTSILTCSPPHPRRAPPCPGTEPLSKVRSSGHHILPPCEEVLFHNPAIHVSSKNVGLIHYPTNSMSINHLYSDMTSMYLPFEDC